MGQEASQPIPIGGRTVKIVKELGEGGYSFVYIVEDIQNGEQFALKRMLAQMPERVQLAQKEVALMKSLEYHPNIVEFFGACRRNVENSTEFFILMEYCPGGHVVDILNHRNNKPFKEKEVCKIFSDVCQGVKYFHSQKPPIAHRDLKVENILLARNGNFKLCDFGSATTRSKVYESKAEIAREEEQIQKHTTSLYRAPEMMDLYSRQPITEKVDIWALGCILFTIAFRFHPFQETGNLAIMNGKYSVPENHEYSCYVEDILKETLRVKPPKRADIFELESYIEEWKHYLKTGEGEEGITKKKKKKKKSSKESKKKKETSKNSKSSSNFVENEDWDPFDEDINENEDSNEGFEEDDGFDSDPFGTETTSKSTVSSSKSEKVQKSNRIKITKLKMPKPTKESKHKHKNKQKEKEKEKTKKKSHKMSKLEDEDWGEFPDFDAGDQAEKVTNKLNSLDLEAKQSVDFGEFVFGTETPPSNNPKGGFQFDTNSPFSGSELDNGNERKVRTPPPQNAKFFQQQHPQGTHFNNVQNPLNVQSPIYSPQHQQYYQTNQNLGFFPNSPQYVQAPRSVPLNHYSGMQHQQAYITPLSEEQRKQRNSDLLNHYLGRSKFV